MRRVGRGDRPVNSPLLPTYARADISFEKGEGPWLVARDGERYLDFGAGIAVNALGHAHPHLVKALTEQAAKVWHTSNLYQIPEGERLAQRLVDHTFADVVFFSNSGAEANEAAIKIARKYHAASGRPERYRIVTFEGAFHGRTLATLAASGSLCSPTAHGARAALPSLALSAAPLRVWLRAILGRAHTRTSRASPQAPM